MEKEIKTEVKKSDSYDQINSNKVDNGNNKSDDTSKDTKSKEKEKPKRKREEPVSEPTKEYPTPELNVEELDSNLMSEINSSKKITKKERKH